MPTERPRSPSPDPSVLALDAAARRDWERDRLAVLRGVLDPPLQTALRSWVDELVDWPETPGRWMKYFEAGPSGPRLCRVENFLPYHEALRAFLLREDLLACLAELLGEAPVLFKEKVNLKLPGGAGFAAHQDAPAFVSFEQHYHVTVMISVDPSGPHNGGLEFVAGHREPVTLAQEGDGTLARAEVESRRWQPLETTPADLVFFDSYVPHRSGPNRDGAPRRAFYVTYNRASEGDRREDYYALKRRAFPPECERDPERPPDPEAARIFNLGNPIR